jgi:glycosyltransferase involved in cell wall biosynthesis
MTDLNRNRRLIAVSQATLEAHVARGMDRDRVVVIRNGVDLTQFQPRPRRGWLRRELHVDESAMLIATIGQIGLRKGQDVLAMAAPEIIDRVSTAHFLMIGERTSTKLESVQFEQSIHQSFADTGLSRHLHLLGYRDDVSRLLSEVDLIVHPANQEPFGRVLLEAAASGVPVVATRVGGTEEIVVDGVTGILVPPRNPAELAKAVIHLLNDPLRRQTMSDAANAHAVRNFEITRCAQQLSEDWQRMIEDNS